MRRDDLLIEIGTEELPPKALKTLGESFHTHLCAELNKANLNFNGSHWYAAPRRLAVLVQQVENAQADKQIEKRGPAVQAAFDEAGAPTKAALGWANANGISVDDAQRLKTDKGEWLLHVAFEKGKQLSELIEELVSNALNRLPIPKPMRWGDYAEQFIRPVHTICILYGEALLPAQIKGVRSSRTVRGHRFHGQGSIELASAAEYASALESQYVIADFEARKSAIREQLESQASNFDANADFDELLLEEIASLVEWPVVMSATFDHAFLEVPKEALIYTMKDDQKYVPLLDVNGNLMSRFLFVSNIQSTSPEKVVSGNERVIRPRLADAQFFFETDKKTPLFDRVDNLKSVLFQKQLGTLADKSKRIEHLAGFIADHLNTDKQAATRAGLLCKTDLLTNMVMEFPDVQGVMGMYYARHDGESDTVANALFEQYLPRFAGDAIPSHPVSCALALADKLDTLVGIFGIGMLPKGDKDPFALRRNAIGLIRIIAENQLDLDLVDLVTEAQRVYGSLLTNSEVVTGVIDFILGRFKAYYQEQGIPADVIQSVAARKPTKPADYAARIKGVVAFKALPQAVSLAAANKRVANILSKNHVSDATEVNQSLFESEHEKQLAQQIDSIEQQVKPMIEQGNYEDVLNCLAHTQETIDGFFDNVMVMADDHDVRNNRLAMLTRLRRLFLQTADVSLLG